MASGQVPDKYLIDIRRLVLLQGLSGTNPLAVLGSCILPRRPPCLQSTSITRGKVGGLSIQPVYESLTYIVGRTHMTLAFFCLGSPLACTAWLSVTM